MSSGFWAKESYHSLINFEFPHLNLIELTFCSAWFKYVAINSNVEIRKTFCTKLREKLSIHSVG